MALSTHHPSTDGYDSMRRPGSGAPTRMPKSCCPHCCAFGVWVPFIIALSWGGDSKEGGGERESTLNMHIKWCPDINHRMKKLNEDPDLMIIVNVGELGPSTTKRVIKTRVNRKRAGKESLNR